MVIWGLSHLVSIASNGGARLFKRRHVSIIFTLTWKTVFKTRRRLRIDTETSQNLMVIASYRIKPSRNRLIQTSEQKKKKTINQALIKPSLRAGGLVLITHMCDKWKNGQNEQHCFAHSQLMGGKWRRENAYSHFKGKIPTNRETGKNCWCTFSMQSSFTFLPHTLSLYVFSNSWLFARFSRVECWCQDAGKQMWFFSWKNTLFYLHYKLCIPALL